MFPDPDPIRPLAAPPDERLLSPPPRSSEASAPVSSKPATVPGFEDIETMSPEVREARCDELIDMGICASRGDGLRFFDYVKRQARGQVLTSDMEEFVTEVQSCLARHAKVLEQRETAFVRQGQMDRLVRLQKREEDFLTTERERLAVLEKMNLDGPDSGVVDYHRYFGPSCGCSLGVLADVPQNLERLRGLREFIRSTTIPWLEGEIAKKQAEIDRLESGTSEQPVTPRPAEPAPFITTRSLVP